MRSLTNLISKARNFTQTARNLADPQTTICLKLKEDRAGTLQKCLDTISQNGISISRIESRAQSPIDKKQGSEIVVDFAAKPDSPQVRTLIDQLKKSVEVGLEDPIEVPWFPRQRSDLDDMKCSLLKMGEGLTDDYPGCKDQQWLERREQIGQISTSYKSSMPSIPKIEYTQEEVKLWGQIYSANKALHKEYAVPEFNEGFVQMEKHCGFAVDNIPQIEDVNNYLNKKTNFWVRPIAGLLTTRDWLNTLAFRTFYSTQYIRHHSIPGFCPEPDLFHEITGHIPMLTNKTFCDFNQEIGMASLGATDEQIRELACNYWYLIEIGVEKTKERGLKIFGGAVLSATDEMKNMIQGGKEFKLWTPKLATEEPYPLDTIQPKYLYTESFYGAMEDMIKYARSITKPFSVSYDVDNDCMTVDKNIKTVRV